MLVTWALGIAIRIWLPPLALSSEVDLRASSLLGKYLFVESTCQAHLSLFLLWSGDGNQFLCLVSMVPTIECVLCVVCFCFSTAKRLFG